MVVYVRRVSRVGLGARPTGSTDRGLRGMPCSAGGSRADSAGNVAIAGGESGKRDASCARV